MMISSSVRMWAVLTLIVASPSGFGKAADELDLPAIAELHFKEATAYSITLKGDEKPLELQKSPIFKWQNITAETGQVGAIYVWTKEGRPEVIGTIFSQPEANQRNVIHEFHTLAQKPLIVDPIQGVKRHWVPKGTFAMKALNKAPAVAETHAKRLIQMRKLANEFTAYTQSGKDRIELRLATQPLIRYQPTRVDIQDGALFAYLNSAAGTDPEVLLMFEARRADPQSTDWTWQLGIARFTDRDLVVTHNDVEMFSSLTNPSQKVIIEENYRWLHVPDDTYVVFHAKFVPELLAAPTKP